MTHQRSSAFEPHRDDMCVDKVGVFIDRDERMQHLGTKEKAILMCYHSNCHSCDELDAILGNLKLHQQIPIVNWNPEKYNHPHLPNPMEHHKIYLFQRGQFVHLDIPYTYTNLRKALC